MKSDYIALNSRISEVLADLERVVSRAEFLLDKARNNNEDSFMDGVALNLHSFYTGVERIFEDIARVQLINPCHRARTGIRICYCRCRHHHRLSVSR